MFRYARAALVATATVGVKCAATSSARACVLVCVGALLLALAVDKATHVRAGAFSADEFITAFDASSGGSVPHALSVGICVARAFGCVLGATNGATEVGFGVPCAFTITHADRLLATERANHAALGVTLVVDAIGSGFAVGGTRCS